MTFQDQLADVQSRIDAAKERRQFASFVGRRYEANQWDLELGGLEWEKSGIEGFLEGAPSESP